MSSLPEVCGHADLQDRFRAAALSGRLPQSLLLHGAAGVGKERLGLWIGALALCDAAPEDRPCGVCRSCRMVAGLRHPDLHWFFPLRRPRGSHTPTKLRQLLEDARGEAIAARRENPLALEEEDGSAAIYLAMVDEIRARATRRPAVGRSSVFVIGDAERMVPQAASQEAANAFLKLLEEPPPDTLLVLTSSRPGSLLPTIRSRVLGVRVTPADPAEAEAFLERVADLPPPTARELARRTQGAVGAALRLADSEASGVDDAWALLRCAATGSPADRFAMAVSFPVSGARGPFSATLDRVEEVLRECLTRTTGSVEFAWHDEPPEASGQLSQIPVKRLLAGIEHVEKARRAASGNANPQVVAAVLLARLARELRQKRPGARSADRNAAPGRV